MKVYEITIPTQAQQFFLYTVVVQFIHPHTNIHFYIYIYVSTSHTSIFLLRGTVHSVYQNTYASALYLCKHSQHCDSPTIYAHTHTHATQILHSKKYDLRNFSRINFHKNVRIFKSETSSKF